MYMVLFFSLILCMLACHIIAKKKGLQPVAWGVSGAVLGPIALIVILLVPSKKS